MWSLKTLKSLKILKTLKTKTYHLKTSHLITSKNYPSIAATPGSTLPSIASSKAPPPVEI